MIGSIRRRALAAALLVLAATAGATAPADAKPAPGAKPRTTRLFARTLTALTINRVACGLDSAKGNICVDSTGSATIGGGYWPKGSAQQYVFNSGLQIAGKISSPGFAWDGDVTGAFFFDPKGTTEHGEEIQAINNSVNPEDVGTWPDNALVPDEPGVDPQDKIFFSTLIGRRAASQGDVHFLTWDGNPALASGRAHPLGVLVESRGMGWNYPAGNQDILYFVFTFYNVTAADPSVYAGARPEIRPTLEELGTRFKSLNDAAFPGLNVPTGGYTIDSLFAAFAADMDVTGSAGTNYSTVNLPFAMGFSWEHTFTQIDPGPYDPRIFGAPFFPGAGFVGVKYLRGPNGDGEIQLFSNTLNAATSFRDAQTVTQLFRYLSGNISTAAGDAACNTGDPRVTRICFIAPTAADSRFFQSSPALTLAPGEYKSIVVAYIFAAPVAVPTFVPGSGRGADVTAGDPRILTDVNALSSGANLVDSLTGFVDWNDINSDGEVQQDEFEVVTGSLLQKALVAQAVYNAQFLLPSSPESPEFYLIPGDNEVTVVWRESATEAEGDNYFQIASQIEVIRDGSPIKNPLYDPNYREFDVEGYRIYRGRVNNGDALELIAQFDYAGTVMRDYTGQVNPLEGCAPELGVTVDCPVAYDLDWYTDPAGVTVPTVFVEQPISGNLIQVQLGSAGRVVLSGDQTTFITLADTASTGAASGGTELIDNGVPFAFVDRDVRNNTRYFYSVTAFDVNSFQSGPSTLESPRSPRPVTPLAQASNQVNAVLQAGVYDSDGELINTTREFTIDAATGTFNGPPPATNTIDGVFLPLVPALLPAVNLAARIDSVNFATGALGECGAAEGALGNCAIVYVTFNRDGVETEFVTQAGAPVWSSFGDPVAAESQLGAASIAADAASLQRYGIPAGFTNFTASVGITQQQSIDFSAHEGQAASRSSATAFFRGGAGISPGGTRWFSGANESVPHPGVGVRAGHLDGVDTIWSPNGLQDTNPAVAGNQRYTPPAGAGFTSATGVGQCFAYSVANMMRQADIEVRWGAGGAVEVWDVTHNVAVPFSESPNASYGFLATDGNGDGFIGHDDFSYLPKLLEHYEYLFGSRAVCGGNYAAPKIALTATPTLVNWVLEGNRIVHLAGSPTRRGYALYINGQVFFFDTQGQVPAAGTVWTARFYSGYVRATTDPGGFTPSGYQFVARGRPSFVPGLEVRFVIENATTIAEPGSIAGSLDRVHTVPDPYYVTSAYEVTTENKVLKFVNLPTQAIIRIYTTSGVLVRVLEQNSSSGGSSIDWDLRNRNNQFVASGVYFYHVESGGQRKVGRFTVVNFAQ